MRSPDQARRDFVREWLSKAETDLAATRALVDATLDDYAPAAFHAQQAAEKMLKAWMVRHQIEIPRSHDLGKLVHIIAERDREFANDLQDLDDLTAYAVEYRYPGDFSPVSLSEARDILALTEKSVRLILESLSDYLR
jgi:HEPN domain-containing protein